MLKQHVKMAGRFARAYFRNIRAFEVTAQIWNACDQKCIYCRCPEVETETITFDQWTGIIRSLKSFGTMRLKFQGGEPTLHPDFRNLSREGQAAGLVTAAVTNGVCISRRPELLDFLDEVVVSLDSANQEINDSLRGSGAFEAAMRTIDIAVDKGLRTFVNMALCKKNLADLPAVLEFCESRQIEMNAQPIKFGVKYYDEEARSLALSPDEIRETHRQLAHWRHEGRAVMFSQAAYLKVLDWPDPALNAIQGRGKSKCMAGNFYFHIDPDGDVIPCIPHVADFKPKNILRDGLKESFRHCRSHNCEDCWSAYLTERKMLYRLQPAALKEYFRRSRSRK